MINYSILPLRIGLGLAFLFFGLEKLNNIGRNMAEVSNLGFTFGNPEYLKLFVLFLGVFEILIALSLFSGILLRLTAFGASLFLITILISYWFKFGFLEYRDIGLLGMSISLLISGPGNFSLDKFVKSKI